jgi:ankyrin repeat protein
MTILHWVCDSGQLDKAEWIVGHSDVDINQQDDNGMTPLHYAYILSSNELINFLESLKGIDTNIKDNDGMMPKEYQD